MVFGEDEVTSGASSDLMQATMLAQEMVTKYGMSDSVGPVFHSKDRVVRYVLLHEAYRGTHM